jgi:uncharacterized Tic20 family protein
MTPKETIMTESTSPVLPPAPVLPPLPATTTVAPSKDERMWAMFCHLAAFVGVMLPVPFGSVIGPLVVWMIKKDEYPLVADQGKEAVNFQISVAIYSVVSALLVFLLIGFFMLGALAIFGLVCVVMGAMKANEGESFRYPLCIRFIK